ncbi:MAG: FAD:protein FMN transferase, partial [Verrucomicrobiota bacterium]
VVTNRSPLKKIEHQSKALGTRASLTLLHADAAQAREAIREVLETLNEIEDILSLYRPHSQISRLNETGFFRDPDPHFLTVLNCAQQLSKHSSGAFDITVQPLWDVFCQTPGPPTPSALANARNRVGWQQVVFDEDHIRLKAPGTAITLNGIAQGYATDVAMKILKNHGIQHALVDCGELAGSGQRTSGQRPWQIAIRDPRGGGKLGQPLPLDHRCLATSADDATTFASPHHHHLFDPKTGTSANHLASVSVLAPSAMTADALSTTLFVTGPEEGRALIQQHYPEADALFVDRNGGIETTEGFPQVI